MTVSEGFLLGIGLTLGTAITISGIWLTIGLLGYLLGWLITD